MLPPGSEQATGRRSLPACSREKEAPLPAGNYKPSSQITGASAGLGMAESARPLTEIRFLPLNGFGLVEGSASQTQI